MAPISHEEEEVRSFHKRSVLSTLVSIVEPPISHEEEEVWSFHKRSVLSTLVSIVEPLYLTKKGKYRIDMDFV